MAGVTIRLVGSFAVRRDSERADAGLGSRKARRLLTYLAVEGNRTVPVDRIVDVLWSDSPPRRPAGNVATLVSRLRATVSRSRAGRCGPVGHPVRNARWRPGWTA